MVNGSYLDEKSFGYQYLKERCCMVAGMNLRDDKGRILFNILCVYHGASNRWRLCKDEKVEDTFFQQIIPQLKKIAYAPSFGEDCDYSVGPKKMRHILWSENIQCNIRSG